FNELFIYGSKRKKIDFMKAVIKEIEIEAKKTSFLNVFKWSSYDAADTMFSQGIISIAFQPYVLLLAFQMGITNYWEAFAIMSVFMAASNLLVALFGPVFGALSDTMGKRKSAVIMSASLMVTGSLGFLVWKNFWWACIMFVFANFAYQAGRMFYDSMIPFISKTNERGLTSGISGALSFLGTFAAIGLAQVAYVIWGPYTKPDEVFSGNITNYTFESVYWLFGIIAGAIVIFSIPFLFSKEKENPNENGFRKNFRDAIHTYKQTLGEIVRYKNAWLFILGWFFVTDASNTTVLYMQLVMVDGAGATPTQALLIIAVGGLLSIFGAIVVGILLDKVGPKKNFLVNIIAWIIAVTIAILACVEVNGQHIIPWQTMFAVAFFIGIGFGGIWLIGRQFVFETAPPSKVTQYQGFKQIAGRVSAILSPLIFLGIFSLASKGGLSTSNSYAISLSTLILFFIIGFIIVSRIIDVHQEYLAGERAPYKKLTEI
ncbi:MAG: MFS transporter, partial [Candidatus Heimdallarchaeaceae archaeon]